MRVVDQRSRNRDPLLLAAGQFFREGVHAMLQPDPLEYLERLALLRRERQAQDAHDEGDVLKDSESGNQPEILEHEPDAAAVALNLRGAQRVEVAPEDFEIALARPIFPQQEPQKGRLAGAAWPGKKDEFTLVDGEGKVAQGVDAAAVELRQMVGFDQARGPHPGSLCLCTATANWNVVRSKSIITRDKRAVHAAHDARATSAAERTRSIDAELRAQCLSQQLVDALRIRFAGGGLHDLTDEEAERRRLARAILRDGVAILREHVGDQPDDL